ncbi:MAG: hypothetical protein U5L95_01955 [Candidatus Saccharibacteria bacterium]|nr:hypothetical protein [Candidatus Saccharibacteria bacterium]
MNPQNPGQQNNPQQPPAQSQPGQAYAPQNPGQQQAPGQQPPPQQSQGQQPTPQKSKEQPPAGNPNSTQNSLQIAEVRDGIVIMNDGSFRSVVAVRSINFDLMSPEERDAVEYSYQGFLNSLYFPIQIFLRSRKVDMTPYIQKLDKIRGEHDNMLLSLLMEDYITYIDNLSLQTNIMDKNFYVVIPYFPEGDLKQAVESSRGFFQGLTHIFKPKDVHVTINEATLNKAKDELRNRVQAVLNGLQQCGIQGIPLDTQELIELYYDTYNPDTATRQQLKDFNTMTAPVVTKGEGQAAQPQLEKDIYS